MGAALAGVAVLLAVGAPVARALRARAAPETAFVAGLALLYLVALAHDALGLRLRAGSLGLGLTLAGAAAAVVAWRAAPRPSAATPAPSLAARLALAGVVALGLVLAWRVTLQPLAGNDTWFRWGLLAELALEEGGLGFYPPRTAADHERYFFCDGIPPLVSLSYAWLHALAGEPTPRATAALVVLQWAACCSLAARLGARLGSARAGALAALALASCPLFLRVVGAGQESGLLALALLLATHALVADDGPPDRRALLVAGLALGVAASAREYGWAFVLPALLLARQRGADLRGALLPLAVALAVAGPWYLRSALRTGDPLHGDLALLRPDPVRVAILEELGRRLAWSADPAGKLATAGRALLLLAPLQLLVGAAACVRRRELWPGVLLVVLLWAASVRYTDGGVEYSLRVLAPALALLSVAVGLLLDRALERWPRARWPVVAALVAAWAWALAAGLAFPVRPWEVPRGTWARHVLATRPLLVPPELALREPAARALPEGTRVLALNPYVSVALRGTGRVAVPPWSPELRSLFEPGLTEAQALERLRATRVRAYLHDPHHSAVGWLVGSPLGRAMARVAVPVARERELVLVRLELPE